MSNPVRFLACIVFFFVRLSWRKKLGAAWYDPPYLARAIVNNSNIAPTAVVCNNMVFSGDGGRLARWRSRMNTYGGGRVSSVLLHTSSINSMGRYSVFSAFYGVPFLLLSAKFLDLPT